MQQSLVEETLDNTQLLEEQGHSLENTFQLYVEYPYPNAGKIISKNQPINMNTFHINSNTDEHPYYPFAGESEWSITEWLATSGLSKKKINTYFNTAFVCI
jgi:hypothetical protein